MSKKIRKASYFALIDDKGYIKHTGSIEKLLELKKPGTSIAKVTEYVEEWDSSWRPGDSLTS